MKKIFVIIVVLLLPCLLFSMGIKPNKKTNTMSVNEGDNKQLKVKHLPEVFEKIDDEIYKVDSAEVSNSDASNVEVYKCRSGCGSYCSASSGCTLAGLPSTPHCTELKCTLQDPESGESCSSSCKITKSSHAGAGVVETDNNSDVFDDKTVKKLNEQIKTTYEKKKDGKVFKRSTVEVKNNSDESNRYTCEMSCSGSDCSPTGCDVYFGVGGIGWGCTQASCVGATCSVPNPWCAKYKNNELIEEIRKED